MLRKRLGLYAIEDEKVFASKHDEEIIQVLMMEDNTEEKHSYNMLYEALRRYIMLKFHLLQWWLLKGVEEKHNYNTLYDIDFDFDFNKFNEFIALLKILQWWTFKGMGLNNIEEKHSYPPLPACIMMENILSMVGCQIHVDPSKRDNGSHVQQVVDPVTLFDLLQAAHHLQNKNLMDLTCRILMHKVKSKTSEAIMIEFDIDQTFSAKCSKRAHSLEAMLQVVDRRGSFKNINSILNSQGKETFILQSDFVDQNSPFAARELELLLAADFVDVQNSPFAARELEPLLVESKVSDFSAGVIKLLGSSEFLKPYKSMKSTKLTELLESTACLQILIEEDPRLADQIGSDVARCLVQTLKIIDWPFVETRCIFILSHASFDKCSDVIKEKALPLFVKLMDKHTHTLLDEIVIALTHLAYARPDYIQVIIKNNALGAAQKLCSVNRNEVDVIDNLAKFLVAICRGESLCREKFTPNEVKAALTFLDDLFQQKIKSICHIMRACHALSYLSFERYVPIEEAALKRLIGFIFHEDYSVAGSALGVVGNIARWGSDDQIQYLAEDFKLLQSLGQRWLCSKLKIFQKEACRIISNIVARGETFRKNMYKDSLIDPLCRLLEEDDSDVKMEAACSLFFIIYGGKCVQWQNQNLQSLGTKNFNIKKEITSFPVPRPDAAQSINYPVFSRSVGTKTKSLTQVGRPARTSALSSLYQSLQDLLCGNPWL